MRKGLEEYVQKHERFLPALLDSAGQGILSTSRDGRIIIANAKAEEMFGYSRAELVGQPIEILLPLGSRDAHVRHRAQYMAKPRIRPMGIGLDLAGRRKDGTEFPVEVSLTYIETDEGVFGLAFVTDITQRKLLEAQITHIQKMEAIGRLAGGVAHEFNNMLTIIAGYNRMMLDQLQQGDELREYAEEVLRAADRAGAVTNQLLTFSRRQIRQPVVIEANLLLRRTETMLRRLIGEDIDLVFSLDEAAGNIRIDAGQFEQIIVNLAVNARDAMPGGGRITIETALTHLDDTYTRMHLGVRPGDYVMVAVSDNGHGMDAETRRHIFEPFFTTKEIGKGTGLGLATVYGIVKQNGGDIWVYSEPRRGATFKVYFPQVGEATDEPAPLKTPDPDQGAETVLVVEDEPGVRELIGTILKQRGYNVIKAADPLEAIQASQQHPGAIDLLLTDVVMPRMSGRDLAVRLLEQRPTMRVLYLSGYTENAIVHHGVLDPEVDFLGKPFSQDSLAKKIREVLDRPLDGGGVS
ncbi:MAG: ATP-binding protein [Acidobacteriota bacterium]